MKIIFAGTPDFSVPVLQVLIDSGHELLAVYTRPDRPAGRGRRLIASPVKQLALAAGIPVFQPVSLKSENVQAELAGAGADLMIVVAYGLILPQAVLEQPRRGCINVHASLLPRWRGAAPIQRAIQAGDTETGVCLMQMEAGLDTGPVLATAVCPIAAGETGSSLHDKLAMLGAQLLAENLDNLAHGRLAPVVQDEQLACYAAKLDKQEALIDWTLSALQLERQVRAFNSWPVAETRFEGQQLRVWEACALPETPDVKPGSIIAAGRDGIDVVCGSGSLRLLRLQSPGRQPVTAADFVNAHALDGVILGAA